MSGWMEWAKRLVKDALEPGKEEVEAKKVSLFERTQVGLSVRYNDSVVREAIAAGEKIYLGVRVMDKVVLCNNHSRPTYWSQDWIDKHPVCPSPTICYIGVDPSDPLKDVEMDDLGTWFYMGEVPVEKVLTYIGITLKYQDPPRWAHICAATYIITAEAHAYLPKRYCTLPWIIQG